MQRYAASRTQLPTKIVERFMDRERELPPVEEHAPETSDEPEDGTNAPDGDRTPENAPNPPRTTTGKITAPKFGSAGSGGVEFEPGPERD